MAGVLGACASRLASRTRCAVDCVDLAADLECPRPLKCAKLDAAVGLSSLGLGPESTRAFGSMKLDAGAGPPLSVSTGGIEAMLSDGDLTLLGEVYWQLGKMQLPAGAQPDACMTPSDVGALVLLVITNAGPSRPVLCNCDGSPPTKFQLVSMLLAAKQELLKMHAHACVQDATKAVLEKITTVIATITAVVWRMLASFSASGLPCSSGECTSTQHHAPTVGGNEDASAAIDTGNDDKTAAHLLLSLASLCTDAGTAAAASEQWVQTKYKVTAEHARELKTVSRHGGGAPNKASKKVLVVKWRKGDLARWTLTDTIQLKMQVLQRFIEELPPASKSTEGNVHPHLNVSAVSIPVALLSELEDKLRKVFPRTTSASASSKSSEKTKWLTKFFCSIGMMHDKSSVLPGVKKLKFVQEVWNQNGYRLISGGCDGGGKPRIQHLDS